MVAGVSYAVLAIPVFGTGQLGGAPMTPDSVLTAVGIVVTLARTLNEVPTLVASLTSLGGYAHRVRPPGCGCMRGVAVASCVGLKMRARTLAMPAGGPPRGLA